MNPASSYLQPAPHEASGNLIFTDHNLTPYYAIHNVVHERDRDDPIVGRFTYNNTHYVAGMKPKSSGLTCDNPDFKPDTVEEYVLWVEPAPTNEATPE